MEGNKKESDGAASALSSANGSDNSSRTDHIMNQKKKGTAGNVKECANCSSSRSIEGGALHACTRCKVVYYCSRPCQIQHWKKGGHHQFCIPVEKRKPKIADVSKGKDEVGGNECPICLEGLLSETSVTLPCSHCFHGECIQGIRRFGVQRACPLCRAELPPGPEKLFEEAVRKYSALDRRQQMSGHAWQNMTKADGKVAREVAKAVHHAAAEGYAPARGALGLLYKESRGVR